MKTTVPNLTARDVRRLLDLGAEGNWGLLDTLPFTLAAARLLLSEIHRVVEFRQLAVGPHELLGEKRLGLSNLEFLTKLHNLSVQERRENTLRCRIACAKHIYSAGSQASTVTLDDIKAYRAHAVFGFGDRDLDRLFEAGDGDLVKAALLDLAKTDEAVAEACLQTGWSLDEEERGVFERPRP